MTKREAEELIEIEIDGTEKAECTEERWVVFNSLLFMLSAGLGKNKNLIRLFGDLPPLPTDLSILRDNVLPFSSDLMAL